MIPALAGWLLALGAPAWSATQLETSELLAATPEAAAQLPPAYEFTLTAAGTYAVRLRDLGDPAATTPPQPLESLQALITRDLQVVAKLEIEYPTLPDDPIEAATQTFAGTPGTYRVHVLGTIPAGQAGGLFDIRVAPSAGGAAVLEAADAIATEGGPGPGQSELHTTFTIAAAGSYLLALDDRNFPETLDPTTSVILLRQISGGTEVVRIGAGAFNVANAGDTYELFVVATAGAGQAGLYTVSVTGDPSGAVVYRSDNAVGQLPPPTTVNIATGGQYALTLADLEFPEALTEFSAAVTQNGVFLRHSHRRRSEQLHAQPGHGAVVCIADNVDDRRDVGAPGARFAGCLRGRSHRRCLGGSDDARHLLFQSRASRGRGQLCVDVGGLSLSVRASQHRHRGHPGNDGRASGR